MTMNCETAREEMLVADMEELRGESETALSMHLRSCVECRAQAETILGAQAGIANALSALRPASKVVPIRSRTKRWVWLPLPLAAAAALALLVISQQGDDTLPNIEAVTRMMFRETPLVAPPAGKQAMVIEKNNMTIVWLYKEETL
jgi:hypothetical protein